MNAVQSQSYGPEARGGASKAEVIIAEEIDYPKVAEADLCLYESMPVINMLLKRPNGVLISIAATSKHRLSFREDPLPITEIATTKVGRSIVVT